MKITLPIEPLPAILCYNHHAHFLSVLFPHEGFINEFYNNFIQYQINITENSSTANFEVTIVTASRNLFDSFRITFNKSTDKSSFLPGKMLNIISYAESVISNGYYLTGTWNEFFIPNTIPYNKYQYYHDYLIYGFDSNRKIFYTIGYNDNKKYAISEVSYEQFLSALFISDEDTTVAAFKPLDTKYTIDIKRITESLSDYMTKPLDASGDPVIWCGCFGIKALEEFEKVLKNYDIFKRNHLDKQTLQVIHEHKIVMSDRIKYLYENGYLKNKNLTLEFDEVKKHALTFKLLGLKFNITENPSNLIYMAEIANKITSKEQELIPIVIEELKKHL